VNKNKSRSEPTGIERRAFQRHPLALSAKITVAGSTQLTRTIKDVCLGGMLLVDEVFAQRAGMASNDATAEGDLIDITFTLEDGSPYSLHGRIIREDSDSSGVALIDPDLEILQSLMAVSKSNRQHQTEVSNPANLANIDLIAQCTQIVITCVSKLAVKTHVTIVDSLFEQSKTLKDVAEQNMYFETLGVLNDEADKFISLFSRSVIERMASCQNGELHDLNEGPGTLSEQTTELAIVEEEALDNWLADTGTIESVQRTHNEVLTQLERRLSELFTATVDHETNPYGPALFSHAFQDAIASFGLHHKIVIACHKIFKTLAVAVLGELYENLNKHLIEQGVLPNLTYKIPHSETSSEVSQDKHESGLTPDDARDVENDVTSSPAIENTVAEDAQELSSLPRDISNHNIYELVAELRTLKQQLREQSSDENERVNIHPGQTTVDSNLTPDQVDKEQGVALTPNEVLQTLSRIESNCTELNRDDFKKLIRTALADEVDDNGAAKVIASREDQIIDVSNSIFDTILTDAQVPESMHKWLARIEMPVLKMAIEDDSLFMDRDHLVRQVVNKIAQLGLLIGEEETEGTSGVRTALDWLVNLIGTEFDGTLSVFSRVSEQLDLLITAQDKKYDEQLKVVINQFESGAEQGNEVAPDVEDKFDSQDDYEKWLRRAHRIEEGDWILFDLDTDNAKRLRAAWVAQHTGKIVFVDAVGSKDRVVFFEELAAFLHSGVARPLDDANEPAMDRAQYAMLQDLNEQLVYESTHDHLTGLMNRREFEKQIGKALINSRHSDIRHALLFVDLDQFNVINTTYGYEAGDMLLVEMAKIISEAHGHSSVLARLGSDEFGLLLEDVDLEEALEISDDYIHQAREHKFMWDGKRISMGTSIGLVTINNQSESITSLMQNAESSCGLAKEMGGNRTQLYRSGQTRFSHRSEMINWVSKIDEILDESRLQLRCQKIQPVSHGSSVKPHYEVLLVLVDEHGDNISIQNFIEAAEWSNRIVDIDRWVIKEALDWISNNQSILEHVDSFSINLSGRSLSDESLVDYITNAIDNSGVPAHALCFEITETIGVESLSDSANFINRIKQSGCHFSLDDFGSGMSSYAYLKNLPVDYLKIDGTFVKEIKTSVSDYAVVKSICEIGHFMGKRVIAEYVEDQDIYAMLAEIGVDFAQGYGIEKPLMINELLVPR